MYDDDHHRCGPSARTSDATRRSDADADQDVVGRLGIATLVARQTLGPGPWLPWIMLNPSRGDDRKDDPTLQRVIAFSWLWGFDGALVFNLFPFRSPHPRDLAAWVRDDRDAPTEIKASWTLIAQAIDRSDAAMVAWGCPPGRIHYDTQTAAEGLFDEINGYGCAGDRDRVLKVFCLGKTSGGWPTHPMARGKHRIPNDARPVEFTPYPGTIVGLDRDIEAPA